MEAARRLCAEQPKQPSSRSTGSQRSKQNSASNLHIIRLRGLPFSATAADIKAFLAPVELPDGINSIQMVRHPDMRPTGEAYVHLSTETEVMQALNKHKQLMGKRYIEVCVLAFKLSYSAWHGCRLFTLTG
jgi:RNA recognition motif-containing protein